MAAVSGTTLGDVRVAELSGTLAKLSRLLPGVSALGVSRPLAQRGSIFTS